MHVVCSAAEIIGVALQNYTVVSRAGCGVKGTADRTEFLVSLSGPRKRRGLGGACLTRSKMLKPKLDLISTTELFRLHVVPIFMAFEPIDLPYCPCFKEVCMSCMYEHVCMYVCMYVCIAGSDMLS